MKVFLPGPIDQKDWGGPAGACAPPRPKPKPKPKAPPAQKNASGGGACPPAVMESSENPQPDKKFKPAKDIITFDAKSAKIFIGAKMYVVLSKFFEKDFEKFFKKLNASQKMAVINNFCNTFFPKEVKVEHEDPFADWTTEELEAYDKHGIKPAGKVIYIGK
jgi:hypothetical protein